MPTGRAHVNVTVTPEQDAWMRRYARARGLTLSGAYQEVIKRAMAAAAFLVDPDIALGNSSHIPEEART